MVSGIRAQRAAVMAALLGLALTFSAAGCDAEMSSSKPNPAQTEISAQALTYLNHALDLMQKNSLNRGKIDWTKLRTTALHEAKGAVTPADTYPVIRLALLSLNDNHSRLIPPAPAATATTPPMPPPAPSARLVGTRIALIALPGTPSGNGDSTAIDAQYAQQAQDLIRKLDMSRPCGWIVDLRADSGGSFGPMIVGLAPLLTKGLVGYFVEPTGKKQAWTVSAATFSVDNDTVVTVARPYSLNRRDKAAVAILTGTKTASAAEATLIAFHGQPATRTFGAPTRGVPTGNGVYPLSDGASLWITQVQEADRDGTLYPSEPIQPDQVTSSTSIDRPDPTPASDVDAAQRWLTAQPSCISS